MSSSALSLLAREDRTLTLKSGDVAAFSDPEFQAFIDDLILCGEENQGVGIAAPQVGRTVRLFIMASKPTPRYPDAPALQPTAIINPEILRASAEMEKSWEGCLSVPGFRGKVSRHTEIEVSYFDRFGEKHIEVMTGFQARIFQHEFDHLEGVLYPTRMEEGDTLVTLEEYTAITGYVVPR